jgi:uncharacterized protein with FMN-binding domain
MKRAALAIVGTVVGLVLLLSFKTHGTAEITAPTVAVSPSTSGSSPDSSSPNPSSNSNKSATRSSTKTKSSKKSSLAKRSAKTKTPPATSTAKTYSGNVAETQYGPVEVQITVRDGKLSAASAVEYPNQDPRDAQINSYAIPQLNSEATQAGSARIDTVSGATYTSGGYVASLQSALDKAGL